MPVIEVDSLRKAYGDTLAVDDVSFTVADGEIFGILGRNGAGKTTTVECVEGVRAPDAGTIRVLGLDPQRDRSRLRHILGVQLQQARLPDKLRVGEALRLYRSFYPGGADVGELTDALGLSTLLNTPFEELSGGQQQRLSVALALVGSPTVTILDEVTTGLDPQSRRDAWELITRIRDTGVTVVLVTHLMDEAERLCDRVALINGGRLVATDTPAGLVRRARLGQTLRFRPDPDVDVRVLLELPEVHDVASTASGITVTGDGDLVYTVTAALLRAGVAARDLQVQQPTLEDAFLALTGQAAHTDVEEVAA